MGILKNIKIPTKIFCGFGIIIALMLIATVLGSISLTGANADFDEYRALARQTNAVSRIQTNMLLTRIYAKNFVISADKSNIAMVHGRARKTTEAVAKANKLAENPAYKKTIDELDGELHHYMDEFTRVTDLQAERNNLVLQKLNVIGPATERALTQIMESAYKDGDLQASYWAGKTMRNLLLARLYAARFLIQNDEASYKRSLKEFAELNINRQSLIKELDNPHRQQLAQVVTENYRTYDAAFKKVHKIILDRNNIIKNHLDRIGPKVAAQTENLDLTLKAKQAILGPLAEAEIDRATHVTIGVSILTLVLGISAACLIGAGISRPVVSMTNAMGELADGNTAVVIPASDHRDELGDMANAMQIFKDNKIKADALAEHERIIQKELTDAHHAEH
jgi:CHASE3 domain sensor protein/HAMP domain-containing protein